MRAPVIALCVATLLAAVPASAQSLLPERFALRARATGNNRPVRVEITIERWSDPTDSDSLLESLTAGGAAGFRTTLQGLAPAAEMRVDAYRSYPLQFAREFVDEDGSRRILLATHTPIGFQGGEGYFLASGLAFTLIELRVDADGKGDGTAEVTEQVSVDPELRTLRLSGSTAGSVRLSSVRRVSPD